MYNMATMAAEESRVEDAERVYYQWLSAVGKLLGHYVVEGSQEESDLFDLYAATCTPEEAVEELKAQGSKPF